MNRIHRGILRGGIGGEFPPKIQNSPPNLKIAKFGGGGSISPQNGAWLFRAFVIIFFSTFNFLEWMEIM